jgi:hypothetical protein
VQHDHDRGLFHFRRAACSVQFKSRVPAQVQPSSPLANFSSINLVFNFRCSSSPNNPVSERSVDSSGLVFGLSSHSKRFTRLSHTGLVVRNRFFF